MSGKHRGGQGGTGSAVNTHAELAMVCTDDKPSAASVLLLMPLKCTMGGTTSRLGWFGARAKTLGVEGIIVRLQLVGKCRSMPKKWSGTKSVLHFLGPRG